MFEISTRWGWVLGMAIGSAIAALKANDAQAQITADNTLPTNSLVRTQDNIRIIEGGTQTGSNVFHSFQQFSVPNGSEAYFSNAANIQNIITRVTGGLVSNIDGLIRANGSANLFLINPNGIIFGPNASLNIGGSFVASTAGSFRFSNGSEFSATNPQAPPLLTVNLLPGLQYGLTQPDSRLDNAGRLRVGVGQSLTFHGGTITSTGSLIAPGGAITLEAKGNISTGDILSSISQEVAQRSLIRNGGAIRLSSKDGEINTTAGNLFSEGVLSGGDITFEAKGNISTRNISTASILNSGEISLSSSDGEINTTAGTLLSGASTFGGAITLKAKGNISTGNILTGNNLTPIVPRPTLRGGAIRLSSKDGEINTTAGTLFSGAADPLSSGMRDLGGGAITLEAKGNISTGNILSAIPSLTSKGGAIRLSSKDGEINTTAGTPFGGVVNGVPITVTDTLFSGGVADGGAITLEAKGNISTGNILTVIPSLTSKGGAIRLSSKDGEINTTAGTLSSGTSDIGGAITLEAKGNIGIRILDASAETVKAGDINITSNAEVYTTDDGYILSETRGSAQGGDINITSRSLVIQGGTRVSPSTRGSGKGGNLTVRATEFVKVSGVSSQENNNSGLFNLVVNSPNSPKTTGAGGDITIETGRLIVEDGGQISASAGPSTIGNAGKLTVKAAEVEVSGVAPPSFKGDIERGEIPVSAVATATLGEGNGGKLEINTERLIIRDGAVIATATGNTGDGGSLTINASEFVKVMGGSADGRFVSGLSADTIGAGNTGNLTLTTGKLILSNGGGISASTVGSNPGGNISIRATSVQIQGTAINGFASGVYAQTFTNGKGGDVTINTGQLTVSDRATITAASRSATDTKVPRGFLNLIDRFGNSNATVGNADNLDITAKGNAGNLDITANSILLNNQGSFLTSTASGQGGDIRLQVRDILLMRRNSQISTTAGIQQAPGNGGNITINDSQNRRGFIVAAANENSDITANAFSGTGGKVQINALGIYGTQFRATQNPLTSDITASSTFGVNGTVELNTPDVDPSRGLVQLPTNLVDLSNQIDQSCYPRVGKSANRFIVTGRGGLPQSPYELLQGQAVITEWVTLDSKSEHPMGNVRTHTDKSTEAQRQGHLGVLVPIEQSVRRKETSEHPTAAAKEIVEANGWLVDKNGDIYLIAQSAVDTPHSPLVLPTSCSQ